MAEMLLAMFQTGAEAIPWSGLLQYGPPGVMAVGLVTGARLLVNRLDAMERRTEATLTARDQAFLLALKDRDAVLADLSKTIGALGDEQRAIALLIGSFTRLLERGDGKRLAPGTADAVVAAVNRSLGPRQ